MYDERVCDSRWSDRPPGAGASSSRAGATATTSLSPGTSSRDLASHVTSPHGDSAAAEDLMSSADMKQQKRVKMAVKVALDTVR